MTTFRPPSVSTLAAVPPPAPEPMMQTSYTLGERITWDIQNLRENRGLRRNRSPRKYRSNEGLLVSRRVLHPGARSRSGPEQSSPDALDLSIRLLPRQRS